MSFSSSVIINIGDNFALTVSPLDVVMLGF